MIISKTTTKHEALPTITEIEESTVAAWLKTNAITVDHYGQENTYYIDQFGLMFFCKNYPQPWRMNFGIY